MGAPVTVEELEIVIRAKVGEALANMQQVINRMEKLINQQIPQLQPKLDQAMQKADQVIDRDADKIIASIDRLAESQADLNRRLEQTADRYDEALDNAQDFLGGVLEGMAEGMEEVAKNTDRAGKETEEYGKKAEKVTKKVGSRYNWLTGQIRGMIVSMALYGVIDLFTTSVSTAATEMAKLDEETNEMLSSYKSSFEYAQMSFGTAMLPLLEAAEPLVTSIADGFAEVSNYIGMFFAALNGQTTYNKVIKKTADYLEDTAGAAEEVKRSIAGFDELNIIGQEDVESGWEIEEVEIPQWMQTLGKYIDAETLAMGALGLGIAGLLGKLSKLTQGFKDKNDALTQQTDKTKADEKALESFAKAFAPVTSGVGQLLPKLALLGALTIIPTLDTEPFWKSKDTLVTAIDEINEKDIETKTVPALDLESLFNPSVADVHEAIDGLNALELISLVFPGIDIETNLSPSVKKANKKIDELNALEILALVYPAIDIATNLAPDASYISGVINKLGKLVITPLVFPALKLSKFLESIETVKGKFIEVEEKYDALLLKLNGSTVKTGTVLTQNTPEYTDPRFNTYPKSVVTTSKENVLTQNTIEYTDPRFNNQTKPKAPTYSNSGTSSVASDDELKEFYSTYKGQLALGTQELLEKWIGGNILTFEEQLTLNSIKSAVRDLGNKVTEFLDELLNNSQKLVGSYPIQIPMAAQGAVSFKPSVYITGEYPGASMNPEIIAPQNMMYDTVVAANGELVTAMYSIATQIIAAIEDSSGGDVYLDGRKITSNVIEGIKAEKRRTGKSPI